MAGRGLNRTGGLQEEHHGSIRWRKTVPHWDGDRPLPGLHAVIPLPGTLPSSPHSLLLPTSWCNLLHVWPPASLHHLEWRQKRSWKHSVLQPCCLVFVPIRVSSSSFLNMQFNSETAIAMTKGIYWIFIHLMSRFWYVSIFKLISVYICSSPVEFKLNASVAFVYLFQTHSPFIILSLFYLMRLVLFY